jgi:ABC-type antimicrobial peptide transport system permease subunit
VRYVSGGEPDSQSNLWYEIVGLVDEISSNTPRARIYHPMLPGQIRTASLTLRAGSSVPSDFTRRLLGITTAVDANLHVEELRSLADVYRQELWEDNLMGFAVATLILVVLLFSAAGIHTLVTFAVAQRRREIGIRSALGAPPLRLVADAFRRDLSPVVAGAVIGAFMAFTVDKLVPPNDGPPLSPATVLAALMFMVAIGLLAVAGPARRLLRVDSTTALREN